MKHCIGNKVVRLTSIDSTNNYANLQIREKELPEGTVFLAYEQTAGRGQMKNFWESEPGMNLTFSIVLFPEFLEIRKQFMLSKIVTLGIYQALNKKIENLRIKWPNDIYVGNKKLGGILIENSIMYGAIKSAVIGIGLNVNQTVFKSNAPNPVSLKSLTNQHQDCDMVLADLLSGIDTYYSLLRDGKEKQINREFISVLYRLNEKHTYRSEGELFEGTIVGVNGIGQLQIRKDNGQIAEFHFKEVEFVQQNGNNQDC